MREWLRRDLVSLRRPFGEFIPGGNAAPPGLIDEQLALVKQIKIQGKTITLPGKPPEESNRRQQRRAERAKRRSAK
jgi:hypothetical protein